MRKIDSLLSEQKKRLLRRVNMSAQHQVSPHTLLQSLALNCTVCDSILLSLSPGSFTYIPQNDGRPSGIWSCQSSPRWRGLQSQNSQPGQEEYS